MKRTYFKRIISQGYKYAAKPLFFLTTPDFIHERITTLGEFFGKSKLVKSIVFSLCKIDNTMLSQNVAGILCNSPVGLSAGFDYEAKLTQFLPSLGFGFETVGTITYSPYIGNPKPMLGRLPKSKSLMVNKGFKNPGAYVIAKKLQKMHFAIPLGISIGRTNSKFLSQQESVTDIMNSFTIFEDMRIANSYYELNISCPNLYGNVSFYQPQKLDELLTKLDMLKIKKPIFIKMPISESKKITFSLLKVISKHTIKGVIFGNLQKNRKEKTFDKDEVNKFTTGGFSGKPTFKKSNEYIALTYKHFRNRFIIIGSGGVFNAEDAYTKIKEGASLVQLITGLIFEGPLLVSDINNGLVELLKKDGFTHISQAIGVNHKKK